MSEFLFLAALPFVVAVMGVLAWLSEGGPGSRARRRPGAKPVHRS